MCSIHHYFGLTWRWGCLIVVIYIWICVHQDDTSCSLESRRMVGSHGTGRDNTLGPHCPHVDCTGCISGLKLGRNRASERSTRDDGRWVI